MLTHGGCQGALECVLLSSGQVKFTCLLTEHRGDRMIFQLNELGKLSDDMRQEDKSLLRCSQLSLASLLSSNCSTRRIKSQACCSVLMG